MSVLSNASIPSTECSVSEPSTTAIFMSPKILKKQTWKDAPSTSNTIQWKVPKKIKPTANNIKLNAKKDKVFSTTAPVFTGNNQMNLYLEKSEPLNILVNSS